MAEIASWQRANQKKGAPLEQAPAQHNSKVYAPVSGMTMNSKIATPTQPCGGVVGGMSMKKMPVMLADGGDVSEEADKAAGLEASKGESVGFFERLRMGNIDQEGSEAYNRFGAGRGRAERMKSMPDESEAETRRLGMSAPAPMVEEPKVEAKESMTAADFQRTDKDTSPVAKPARPAPQAPRAQSKKSASEDYDETDRLKKRVPGPRSVVMKPAARSAEFDPDRIDNFGPAPAPVAATVRRHPRTGRPY